MGNSVLNFMDRIKDEVLDADDLTILTALLIRYKGSFLCKDYDGGLVVDINGLLYSINGLYYGGIKSSKFTSDEIIDLYNE